MYEHPYFAEKISEYENERLEQAAERRRFLAEHADQIVPRTPGPVGRFGQRMLRTVTRRQSNEPDASAHAAADVAPDAAAAAPRTTTVAPRASRVAAPAEMAPAAPAARLAAVCCEPAAVR
ncbi:MULTISPECIES: hypothetical protein [Microbacterium]|uniref:hypothetical protein n=1 Tax=Microbacterium TaxID=33882 RepID=UPI0005AC41E8|nr:MULTISPECIES: hypothetical protein [Microbacterium]AQY00367.1 hypothetical protein B2G67_01925 [Microbacterium foliorum]KIP93726.1 hypothetical protein RU09_05155 [Microbacterium sp. MEJ108Y]